MSSWGENTTFLAALLQNPDIYEDTLLRSGSLGVACEMESCM